MAFNLDKNDSSAKADTIKKTGFNLTKDQGKPFIPAQQPKKSKSLLWTLLSLLVAGSIIWYMASKPKDTTNDTVTTSGDGSNTAQNKDAVESNVIPAPDPSAADENEAMPNDQHGNTLEASADPSAEELVEDAPSGIEKQDQKVAASFQKGSVDAHSIDKSAVEDIVKFLRANPNAVITVNGYASSEGRTEVNQQISQARADVFKTYLVSKGISVNKILAIGKGIEHPLASNETEQGRSKNRRVEILLQ